MNRKPKLTLIRRDGSMFSVNSKRPRRLEMNELPRRVYFPRASSTPVPRSLVGLRDVADWLSEKRGRRLFLVGHANQRRWSESARALASARTRAIRDLLVFLGASRQQLGTTQRPKLHPAGKGSTAQSRKDNRYVELLPSAQGKLPAQMPGNTWLGAMVASMGRQRRPPR